MKHADGRVIVFPFHDEVDRDADIDVVDFLKEVR
jgi:hypothetical protein